MYTWICEYEHTRATQTRPWPNYSARVDEPTLIMIQAVLALLRSNLQWIVWRTRLNGLYWSTYLLTTLRCVLVNGAPPAMPPRVPGLPPVGSGCDSIASWSRLPSLGKSTPCGASTLSGKRVAPRFNPAEEVSSPGDFGTATSLGGTVVLARFITATCSPASVEAFLPLGDAMIDVSLALEPLREDVVGFVGESRHAKEPARSSAAPCPPREAGRAALERSSSAVFPMEAAVPGWVPIPEMGRLESTREPVLVSEPVSLAAAFAGAIVFGAVPAGTTAFGSTAAGETLLTTLTNLSESSPKE